MSVHTALPVLDIAPFLRTDTEAVTTSAAAEFVDALRGVVHDIGFFYVTGHGIDPALRRRAHEVAAEFFALPDDDRLAIENVKSAQFRGYTRFGHERTNGKMDLRDQVDIGRELPVPELAEGPAYLRLRGPNLWPPALPAFRTVTTALMEQFEQLGQAMVRALALALGQPADRFADAVTPPEVLMKVIRYMPDETSGDQGVGAHRDTGFVTFVDQDDVGGLQVERDGQLIDVPRLDDALVVNIGEMFQLVTRGYFKATVHRVVSPPAGRERISIAYFFNPKLEATLAPIDLPPELAADVDAANGASADPGNPILANYGENSMKVRLRAHPDVAAIHHADLLPAGAGHTSPGHTSPV
jgi:isopenicillin N synthase-like dioxygenase